MVGLELNTIINVLYRLAYGENINLLPGFEPHFAPFLILKRTNGRCDVAE